MVVSSRPSTPHPRREGSGGGGGGNVHRPITAHLRPIQHLHTEITPPISKQLKGLRHSLSVVDIPIGHVLDPLARHAAFSPVALVTVAAVPRVAAVPVPLVLMVVALVSVTTGKHLPPAMGITKRCATVIPTVFAVVATSTTAQRTTLVSGGPKQTQVEEQTHVENPKQKSTCPAALALRSRRVPLDVLILTPFPTR